MGRPRYFDFVGGIQHKWTADGDNTQLTYALSPAASTSYINLLQLGWVTSAVNYLKITPATSAAALTTGVVLEPVGDSDNIDITIQPKGSGAVNISGLSVGTDIANTTATQLSVGSAAGTTPRIALEESTGKTGDYILAIRPGTLTADRDVWFPDSIGADDEIVTLAATQTLTNKTLTTPTISSFVNATHDHTTAANGGALGAATAFTGTTAGSFTVNSDSATGTIAINPTVGGTDNTVTLTNSTTTDDITVTLPDATTTLAGLAVTQSFTAVQTVAIDNSTTNAVTDVAVLAHTTTGTAAAGLGVGLSFNVEDAGGSEQQGSIDVALTTVTDGSEDADMIFSVNANGDITEAGRFDASAQEFVIGQDSTDTDGFDSIRIWPNTTAKGSLKILPGDNTGDDTVTLTTGNTSGDITVTLPVSTTTLLGKDITGQAGYLQLDGSTSGAIKIAPIAIGTATTTLQNSNTTAVTITLPNATCTLVGTAAANTFTAAQTITRDDTTDGLVDGLILKHTSSDDNATVGDGVSVSVFLENATGTSTAEEWARLDYLSTTITNGSEDGDWVFNQMSAGTMRETLRVVSANAADASDYIQLTANTSETNGVVDALKVKTTGVTATAGFGAGLSVWLSNAAGTSEEHMSIDSVVTTATNGSEDTDIVFRQMAAGAVQETLRLVAAESATVCDYMQFTANTTETNGVLDSLVLKTSDVTGATGLGNAVVLNLCNDTGPVNEAHLRLAVVATSAANGAEDSDFVVSQMTAGAVAETLRVVAASSATVSDYLQLTANTTETNGVVDVAKWKASTVVGAAGLGVAHQFFLSNGASENEERASIDVVSVTETDASEDVDIVFRTSLAGTVTDALRIDSDDQMIRIGRDATDASGINSLLIHSLTASRGGLRLTAAANSSGDYSQIIQTNNAIGESQTFTLPDANAATDNLVSRVSTDTLTNKTIDGDDNTVKDLPYTCPKVMAYASNIGKGIPFIISAEFTGPGTYAYTVDNGTNNLQVLKAWGYKKTAAGANAADQIDIKNSGTTNNIFDTEELNAVTDGSYFEFDGLDDAEDVVSDGNALQIVAGEDAANGCDALVHVMCMWV